MNGIETVNPRTTKKPKIKPCPFCHGGMVKLIEDIFTPIQFFVGCNNCHSCGPAAQTAFEAITAWNRAKRLEVKNG